jgi:hypothetical protein
MRYVLRREKEQLGVFNDFARLYDKRQAWIISRIQSRLPQLIKPVLEDIVAFEAAYFAITASVLDDVPWLLLVLTYCITKLITTWLAIGSPVWESDEQSGIRPQSDYSSDTALDTHSHPVRYHCRAIRQRYRYLLALPVELVSSLPEATS